MFININMKIAILARPRTFSTAIGKTFAHNYDSIYVGETYLNVLMAIRRYYYLRKSYDLKKAINHLKNELSDHTKKIFSYGNFVIKIFPGMLHFPPGIITEYESFGDIKSKYIFDIDILRLPEYDKILILERNLKQSLISWIYSRKIEHYHHQKNENYEYPTITLETSDFDYVRFYLLDYLLFEKIKEYLNQKNISYTIISENNFNDYVNNDILDTVQTPIKYDQYITNIQDLENFVDYWYPICREQTQNWTYY